MRKQKCALSKEQTLDLIKNNTYGVLGLCAGEKPYTVPMNYAYKNGALYFHGAYEGLRYEYAVFNDQASFCVVDHETLVPEIFSTDYASAIVFGTLEIVKDEDEKKEALLALIEHLAPENMEKGAEYINRSWQNACVFKLNMEQCTGKERRRK